MEKNNKNFTCTFCNYSTTKPSDWIKHINSMKHARNGKKKPINCANCNYIGLTHWNLKMHILTQHSTKEQRMEQKYYCKYCDQVFFCSQYLKTHNDGKKHQNIINAIQNYDK